MTTEKQMKSDNKIAQGLYFKLDWETHSIFMEPTEKFHSYYNEFF
jgi:hypothetical protein